MTSYVHITCVSRFAISLYLAVSQLDLDVSWSYTHHMNVTDVHMSAHSSSTADASLDVEPNLIFIISIFLIALSVIRLTAYGVMYVIHIASHTLCDGATYLSRVSTYHVTPRVMLFLCLLSHVTVVAGTPADDTCPNLDDLHDMFIGMVYSHGYANVLMALSAAAAVAVSMADSYDSHDSTRSMRTIISALATATATAASIAGCPAAKLDDMDAEHALLADASDAEPAWLTDAADTLMHTLHVSAADGSAADPANDVAAAAPIADTDAAAAVAAPAAAATTFAVAAVAAPAAVLDDAADDTDAASTVSSLDTAVSSVALHTSDMRAHTPAEHAEHMSVHADPTLLMSPNTCVSSKVVNLVSRGACSPVSMSNRGVGLACDMLATHEAPTTLDTSVSTVHRGVESTCISLFSEIVNDSKSQYVYPYLGKALLGGRLISRQPNFYKMKTQRIWNWGAAPSSKPLSFHFVEIRLMR